MERTIAPGFAMLSDDDVQTKTGRDWPSWFEEIDGWDGPYFDHTELVFWLTEEFGLSNWWASAVAERYEVARGLRRKSA